MKKILTILISFICVFGAFSQQIDKKTQKRIEKEAKKIAKQNEAEGWKILPGGLSMVMQIEKAMKMREEMTDYGQPKYIVETGRASGTTYNAAKLNAVQAAKVQMVNNLEQEYTGMIMVDLGNNAAIKGSEEEVAEAAKSDISNKLGKVNTITEMYMQRGNEYTVAVTVVYLTEEADRIAKESVQKALSDKLKQMQSEL